MNRNDLTVIISLTLLALFIWLRDTAWMSTADDTLPIVAALPIFIWIGAPWNFKEQPLPISSGKLIGSVLAILSGIVLNFTLLLAIGWVLLLWAWLSSTLESDPNRSLSKLLILPLMAFPWISLDFSSIGWWFRLTGAWTTGKIFALFGYNVVQEGTNILIDNLVVNVEVACAGLNILQSMLIAGTVVEYIILKHSPLFWWNLPLLGAFAWISNTCRIIGVTLIALFINPEFAIGSFHQIGGWFILILMFCLCWLFFSLQHPKCENET